MCAIKKIEESLEIYGIYAFRELIVYRICAPACKHVNQLSSTRFPNAPNGWEIKKNFRKVALFILILLLEIFWMRQRRIFVRILFFVCRCFLFTLFCFFVTVLLLDINSDMQVFTQLPNVFHFSWPILLCI